MIFMIGIEINILDR